MGKPKASGPAFASVTLDETIPRAACNGGKSDEWCEPMTAALNDAVRGKGLGVEPIWKLSTGEISAYLVVYRKTARDRGIVLTLCPWCGVSLRPDIERVKTKPCTGQHTIADRTKHPAKPDVCTSCGAKWNGIAWHPQVRA